MDSQEFIPRSRSSSRVLGHECLCDDGNCLGFHCPCYNQQNEICYNHSCCLFCVKLKNQALQMKLPKEREEEKKYREGKLACNCVELRKKTADKNVICKCYQNYPRLFGSQKLSKHQKNVKVKVQQPTKLNKVISVGCSCKKSHCLKKYCHCFAMNNKCSPQCECEDCQNDFDDRQVQGQICNDKVQYSNEDDSIQSESQQQHVDIDQYFEQKNYENLMMPKSMEFDHPDLKNAYHV